MSRKVIAIVVFILAGLFALSPLMVEDFGGFDPELFPIPQVDPPVQPAGYAFAIWGVIYLWLVVGMGYGLWKRRDDARWHPMRTALIPSLAVGAIWLVVAMNSAIWATVLIWVMLISALVALFRSPVEDRWFASLPVGLYAGWLSAASCVSLGLLLAGYGLLDASTAALAMVFLALVIASGVQSQLGRAPSYGIAVIWALVAVVVQNLGVNSTVAALAAGGALAMLMPTYKAWRATV
ncbi:tryptophan-rich sensory protein [Sulfitobacter sp. F26169L]|uniref:tryptophan-rich sensory protein n=1 Tax=Sulfitobacter sp. F26169L TaxID=2996015 RepID=UPI0022609C27|nr:tryptophan-rich sensory protein [Sulfitobacter sp. F26169L]MCX7565038.1 tryptophan-rich sensory protein [Sulfitobacter sp. F26169L]